MSYTEYMLRFSMVLERKYHMVSVLFKGVPSARHFTQNVKRLTNHSNSSLQHPK